MSQYRKRRKKVYELLLNKSKGEVNTELKGKRVNSLVFEIVHTNAAHIT